MRPLLLFLLIALGSPSFAAEQPREVSEQVSVGAVRVTLDRLRERGLPSSDGATTALLDWMSDAGTLNDQMLIEAAIAIEVMLIEGVVSVPWMDKLCRVAPKCDEYMAAGAGLTRLELQRVLEERRFLATSALPKMFAVARNRHYGHASGAWRLVDQARKLPLPR
jgi:hypothetical protein